MLPATPPMMSGSCDRTLHVTDRSVAGSAERDDDDLEQERQGRRYGRRDTEEQEAWHEDTAKHPDAGRGQSGCRGDDRRRGQEASLSGRGQSMPT